MSAGVTPRHVAVAALTRDTNAPVGRYILKTVVSFLAEFSVVTRKAGEQNTLMSESWIIFFYNPSVSGGSLST